MKIFFMLREFHSSFNFINNADELSKNAAYEYR